MTRRRFAPAFVVVIAASCEAPPKHHHRPHVPRHEEVVEIIDAAPPPDAAPEIPELVDGDRWWRLSAYDSMEEMCRHASCNPPRPSPNDGGPPGWRGPPPEPPDPDPPYVVHVSLMKQMGTTTLVRVGRPARRRFSERWHVVLVTEAGDEVPGVTCTIVASDYKTIELSCNRDPWQLLDPVTHRPYRVRLAPTR